MPCRNDATPVAHPGPTLVARNPCPGATRRSGRRRITVSRVKFGCVWKRSKIHPEPGLSGLGLLCCLWPGALELIGCLAAAESQTWPAVATPRIISNANIGTRHRICFAPSLPMAKHLSMEVHRLLPPMPPAKPARTGAVLAVATARLALTHPRCACIAHKTVEPMALKYECGCSTACRQGSKRRCRGGWEMAKYRRESYRAAIIIHGAIGLRHGPKHLVDEHTHC